jgi:RHS repeat-associated protein
LQAAGELRLAQGSTPAQQTSLVTWLALDEVLARVTRNGSGVQQRAYLTDALNSVFAQAREDQSVVNRYRYSAYGETASSSDDEGNAIQYTGRENDGTGLYFYRARYYDAVLKRFLQSDPIGLAGGINMYAYVNGNPLIYTDPLGLMGQGSGGSGMTTAYPPGQGPGQSIGDFGRNLWNLYYNFMRGIDQSLPRPDFNRPYDPRLCATPECVAGILPTADPLRTQQDIDRGQCRLVCQIVGAPATMACNVAVGGGIPGAIVLSAARGGACYVICR